MTFRVGQKVVCVREPIGPVYFPWVEYPKEGNIYTVRGFRTAPTRGLWLAEIISHIGILNNEEAGFDEDRFRPVVERKTSIEIFIAMLNPSKQGVEA